MNEKDREDLLGQNVGVMEHTCMFSGQIKVLMRGDIVWDWD